MLTGKPSYGNLTADEIAGLEKINIQAINRKYENTKFYPYLHLPNHSVITAQAKSKATKRNNSCLAYIDRKGHLQKGICNKLFSTEVNDTLLKYCVITKLTLASNQLCKDMTTHAQLNCHLTAYIPPRYL